MAEYLMEAGFSVGATGFYVRKKVVSLPTAGG
jgi:hypothetical protein